MGRGIFSVLFGSKNRQTDGTPDVDPVLDHVDPQTGFEHSWSNEKRLAFCIERLEGAKEQLGGELKRTEEYLRLYTPWHSKTAVVGVDWLTGDLEITFVGTNTLGSIGIMREDSLGPFGEDHDLAEGWSEDADDPGCLKEYLVDGVYLEDSKTEIANELSRVERIPMSLRTEIFESMLEGRLQTVFATEELLVSTWQQCVFREGDLVAAIKKHLDLTYRLFVVFEHENNPDRTSFESRRCPYCNVRQFETGDAHCSDCGAPI